MKSVEAASKKTVVLCTGSNGTHVLTAELGSRKDYAVRVITRNPNKFQGVIRCTEKRPLIQSFPFFLPQKPPLVHAGQADMAVNWQNAATVLDGSDIILLIGPVHLYGEILEKVVAALPERRPSPILIGTLFAQAGFDWLAYDIFKKQNKLNRLHEKDIVLFGLKRFPYICKADKPGEHVFLHGRFEHLAAAVYPKTQETTTLVKNEIESIFKLTPEILSNWLLCTLNFSNQVLHPAILYSYFYDYEPGTSYERAPYFYAESTPLAHELILQLCLEITNLRDAIETKSGISLQKGFGWNPVVTWGFEKLLLRGNKYRLKSVGKLFARLLNFHQVLAPAKAPMIRADSKNPKADELIPDFESRFYTDDISHGLCVILGLRDLLKVEGIEVAMPTVIKMIQFHQHWLGKNYVNAQPDDVGRWLVGSDVGETAAPQAYGIQTWDQFCEIAGFGEFPTKSNRE